MADSLLFIVQTAAGELGLPIPTFVVGNTDTQTRQLLAHVNKTGRDLVKAYEWSALIVEPYVLTTIANQEFYAFPAGFDRVVGNTSWDRTMQWQLLGPDNPQVARFRRESNISVASPRIISRQEGNQLSLFPISTTGGSIIVFDYVTNLWANTGVAQATPSRTIGLLDTDTCVFDTDLVVKGVKWSFMAAKGMGSAASLNQEFGATLKICIASDQGGGQILSMAPAHLRGNGNADNVVAGTPIVILNYDEAA